MRYDIAAKRRTKSNKHTILDLREALNMYTELYGPKHKDAMAVVTSLGQ
jgi:hypothetical protein